MRACAPRDRILQHWIVIFRFSSKFSTCVSAVHSNVGPGAGFMGESRVIMAVAEPVARLVVLVRLRTPTDSLLPCRRTRRRPAHRARDSCPWMSTSDPLAMRATELSSSASAPQRPFHRPQNDVAAHPQRRPGAQTAVAPPRGLTWAGSERARPPASPP